MPSISAMMDAIIGGMKNTNHPIVPHSSKMIPGHVYPKNLSTISEIG